ncbi:hypothetical protein NLJ89_g11136 [Agrocybe chaxingu]|uniref:Uncharacterized protein n=1 Tax=Agrocybe chaxingu TaxID=84603 RepID=A0A9W8JQI9_9AGAR|nr:hypothetical protein NLJ89_g11136 [Agrocybe chaxingu]
MSSPDSGNDVRPGFFDAMSGPVGGGMGGGEANRPNWIPGVGTPFPQYQAALSSFTPPTAPAPAVPGSPWPYILAPVPALVPVQTTSAWAPTWLKLPRLRLHTTRHYRVPAMTDSSDRSSSGSPDLLDPIFFELSSTWCHIRPVFHNWLTRPQYVTAGEVLGMFEGCQRDLKAFNARLKGGLEAHPDAIRVRHCLIPLFELIPPDHASYGKLAHLVPAGCSDEIPPIAQLLPGGRVNAARHPASPDTSFFSY